LRGSRAAVPGNPQSTIRNTMCTMDRRQSLLCLSTIAAHALFPQLLARLALVSNAIAAAPDKWRPELLSPAQGAVLAELAETILPETDTPGAKAARVHVFIDLALARCVAPAQQQAALAALDALGGHFPGLSPTERQQRVERMAPEPLGLLRELTLLGYFSSEIGATQALAYDAVPGGYRGCIDLKAGQKAWATR
jgi:glucoside 3-dehydrogenase (cytochrome c) hitch-hiker subunit